MASEKQSLAHGRCGFSKGDRSLCSLVPSRRVHATPTAISEMKTNLAVFEADWLGATKKHKMKIGDTVTLTKLGYDQGFVGKKGSVDATVKSISGLSVKVLRSGYSQPQWFHRDFWRKKRKSCGEHGERQDYLRKHDGLGSRTPRSPMRRRKENKYENRRNRGQQDGR